MIFIKENDWCVINWSMITFVIERSISDNSPAQRWGPYLREWQKYLGVKYDRTDWLSGWDRRKGLRWFLDSPLREWVRQYVINKIRNSGVTEIYLIQLRLKHRNGNCALAGVAQWIVHGPVNWGAISSVPGQGTCLGCGLVPPWGGCEK